jgi:protein-L-isoaspartate(D-aspartate) O-methyltransferase
MIEDNYRHQGLRKKLINEIRAKGIDNEAILIVMGSIPRHVFFENAFLEYAYADKAFPIEAGQTISQPYTVAFQTGLLDVRKGMKVLEIGTGSGYQASILCALGCKVFSVERQQILHKRASKLLKQLNFSPKLFFGDGFKGLNAFAPFDRILITCGASNIPYELVDQLNIGGKMVIPIGSGNEQVMTLLLKKENNSIHTSEHGIFRFVPMLKNKVR